MQSISLVAGALALCRTTLDFYALGVKPQAFEKNDEVRYMKWNTEHTNNALQNMILLVKLCLLGRFIGKNTSINTKSYQLVCNPAGLIAQRILMKNDAVSSSCLFSYSGENVNLMLESC